MPPGVALLPKCEYSESGGPVCGGEIAWCGIGRPPRWCSRHLPVVVREQNRLQKKAQRARDRMRRARDREKNDTERSRLAREFNELQKELRSRLPHYPGGVEADKLLQIFVESEPNLRRRILKTLMALLLEPFVHEVIVAVHVLIMKDAPQPVFEAAIFLADVLATGDTGGFALALAHVPATGSTCEKPILRTLEALLRYRQGPQSVLHRRDDLFGFFMAEILLARSRESVHRGLR